MYLLITQENLVYNKNTEIIPSIKCDHCAVTLQFQEVETRVKGKGYWKINSSILDEEEYIKQLQANKIKWLEEFKDIEDLRMIWELFKYKILQFSMRYSKNRANV